MLTLEHILYVDVTILELYINTRTHPVRRCYYSGTIC